MLSSVDNYLNYPMIYYLLNTTISEKDETFWKEICKRTIISEKGKSKIHPTQYLLCFIDKVYAYQFTILFAFLREKN